MNVEFYILNNPQLDAKYRTACQLSNEVYQQKGRAYLYCQDTAQQRLMDDMLWRYDDISFIPHELLGQQNKLPIVIGCDDSIELSNVDTLINISNTIPPCYQYFNTIKEIIIGDEEAKRIGREHYRYYQEKNCKLTLSKQ